MPGAGVEREAGGGVTEIAEAKQSARQRRLVLAACTMAVFMAAVEATIVATAMPTIVGALGGFDLYGWVFAAYLLAGSVTIPIYGKLADLHGRKPVFFVGAAIFLVGSTLCGTASGMITLAACRALQGLGAGSILPLAFTIIADVYPPRERAGAQAIVSVVWGMAAIVGPLLGAFLVSALGWPFVFWVNLPVGALAMLFMGLFFTETAPHRARQIDASGALLLAAGSGALLLALLQMHALGWIAVPLLGGAAILLALLVRHERRAAEPMVPLHLWRNRTILIVNLASLPIGAMMMGVSAFLPPYVQGVMGESTLTAGVSLAAMSIGWSSASPLAARLMHKTSYRANSIIGGLAMLAGSLMLLVMRPDSGALWAAAAAALMGVGLGFAINTFTVAAQGAVGAADRGVATSSTVFTRVLGQCFGTALLGAVLNLGLADRLAASTGALDRLMLHDKDTAELAAAAAALHGVYGAVVLLALLGLVGTALLPAGHRPGREPDA
jgi:EmrB/QacA subfamily drug resistance transporter